MSMQSINMTKMLLLYRYISLVVTSLFYIVGVGQHTINQRLIVITGMGITSLVMNYLYVQNKGDKKKIVLLIVIETIGNCIILIPSGGLQSPYIWYILNTIIIAGLELGHLYLWVNVGVYLANMIGTSYILSVRQPIAMNLKLNYLNLVAGFLLVAFIIELLISYAKALEEKSKQSQQYLDYTMKLYETVYLFTSQGNKESLIRVILEHIGGTLKVPGILFIEFQKKEEVGVHSYGLSQIEVNDLVKQIGEIREYKSYELDSIEVRQYGEGFIGIPIKHTYSSFGMLIVSDTIAIEELKFIAYVSGMIFKKIELEVVNKGLLLSEEQNRIANEIHDSVLQKLFGVSCNLFKMTKRLETMEKNHVKVELDSMRSHVTQAMTDLRETIYGLSWKKSGKNDFVEKLESYIETMRGFHQIEIELQIEGDVERLDIGEQKALYRVCCEAIANGVRHSGGSKLNLCFYVGLEVIDIKIVDNGRGFDYHKVVQEGKLGLGIKNMEQLVNGLNGEIKIDSTPGQGTRLHIHIQSELNYLQKDIDKEGIL